MNQLQALRQYTTVVADTSDFHQLAQFKPQDATTNPSLVLKTARSGEYGALLRQTRRQYQGRNLCDLMDRVLVRLGCEILAIVPGRVSTEVDARLSFDRVQTIERAERLIALYGAEGIPRERVLIKIAATWEGIAAAQHLERQGIHCNLTLLFSFCQAICCAQAQVQLISPFVGRIYDWHKAAAGAAWDEGANSENRDPGVRSVARIHHYFKRHGIATEIMGASFRNTGQILALAGCDLLTISPALLSELSRAEVKAGQTLRGAIDQVEPRTDPKVQYDEPAFRFALNEDSMASDKLSEGIRTFVTDTEKLLALLGEL